MNPIIAVLTTGSCVESLERERTRQDPIFKKWNGMGRDRDAIPSCSIQRNMINPGSNNNKGGTDKTGIYHGIYQPTTGYIEYAPPK